MTDAQVLKLLREGPSALVKLGAPARPVRELFLDFLAAMWGELSASGNTAKSLMLLHRDFTGLGDWLPKGLEDKSISREEAQFLKDKIERLRQQTPKPEDLLRTIDIMQKGLTQKKEMRANTQDSPKFIRFSGALYKLRDQ